MSDREPRNVTSVGGLVVRDNAVLLVRMNYGPNRGRYMLPGGLIDPGETLDVAIAREVLEEAGVEARPVGIIGLRSRYDGLNNDTYVLWLLEYVAGEPRPEGRENDDARFFTLAEIEARDDIADLVRYLARRVLRGEIHPHRLVDDYHSRLPGTTPDSWKLFM